MERIQVLLHPEERERFRELARERGLSLSAWVREAALKEATEQSRRARIRSLEALREFFAACDARELATEPEWEEHLAVLGGSKVAGAGSEAAQGPAPARRPARGSGGR